MSSNQLRVLREDESEVLLGSGVYVLVLPDAKIIAVGRYRVSREGPPERVFVGGERVQFVKKNEVSLVRETERMAADRRRKRVTSDE